MDAIVLHHLTKKKKMNQDASSKKIDETSRKELEFARMMVGEFMCKFFDPQDGYYDALTAPPGPKGVDGHIVVLSNGNRFRVELVPEDYVAPDL
jgi:hypothetical protein